MEKYVTRIGDVTIQRVVPGTAAAVEPVRVMESEELLRAVKEEPMDEEEEEEEEGMEGEEEGGGEEEEGRNSSNPEEEGEGGGGEAEENGGEEEPDGEEEERNKVKKLLNLGEELQLTEGIQLGEGVQLLRVKDEPPDNGYEPEEEGIEEDGMMEEAKEDGEEEERGEQEQGEGEEGEEGRVRDKEEGEGGEEEEEEEEAGGKRKAESDQDEETGLSKKKKLEEEDKDKDKKKAINLRRNIREVMDEAQLDEATLAAQRQEAERLRRVQDQQKYLRENVQVQRQIQINKLNQKNRMISLLQGGSSLLKANSAANSGPSTVLVKLGSGQAQALNKKTLEVLRGSKSVASSSGDTSKPGRVAISRPGMVTPSVSIAPVRSTPTAPTHPSDKKVYDAADGEYVDDDASEVVTISSSDSENDCILISEGEEEDEEEEEEEDVDPTNSGMHTNDLYNIPDEQGRVLINVGKPESESEIFLAPQIARIIKPHQIGGVRFLFDNVVESLERFNSSTGFGCILAHSMGLGKTLQVVSFCDVFLRETDAKTVMCIMPINTLQNWMAEFNMWLPMDPLGSLLGAHGEVRPRNFNIYVLNDMHKTISARAKVVEEWSKEGGVLLIGYEMYRQLSLKRPGRARKGKKRMQEEDMEDDKNKPLIESMHEALVRPGPDLVICDEGHRIKNSHASISHALKQIRTKRRVVLTGYPLQNNLLEYWCMVDFVRPNYLGTKTEFSNMFERPIQNGQCIDSTPQDIRLMRYRAHVLHSLLEGFVQRRSHSVLRNTLPQKEEYVLLVRLTPFQRKLYDTFMNEVVRTKAVPNPLKAFAVCCKIWNHPDILYNFIKKRELDELQDLDLEETAGLAGAGTGRGDVVGPNSPRRASGPGGAREKRKGPVKKVAPIKPEVAQSQQQQSGLPQQQSGGEMEAGGGAGFDLYPPSSCYPGRGAQDLPASYPAYRPPPGAPAPPASGYYPGYYPPHQDTTTASYYPNFPPSSMDPSYPPSIPSSYGFENYPNLPQNQNWSGHTHPPIKQEKNQGKSPKESYEATPKPGFQEYYPIKEEKTGIKEEKQTFLCSGFSGGQVSYNYREMGAYPGYPGYQSQEYPTSGWGKGAFASFGHPMEQDIMGNENLQATLGHHKDSQPVGSSQMQPGNHMGLEERNPKEREVYSGNGQKMYNSQGTQLGLHVGQEYQGSQNQKESNQRMFSAGERQSGGQQSMFHGHMSSELGSSMHGKQELPQQQGLFNNEGPHYGIHSLEQQQRGHNNTDNRQSMFGAQGMHPQHHQTNFMASHQDKQKNVQGSTELMMGDAHSMFPMGQRGQQGMYPGLELGQNSQRNKNTQERTSSGQQQGMFGGGGQHEMMDFREHMSSQTQQGIMGNQNNQGSIEGMSRNEGTQDGAQDIQGSQRMHMNQEYVQGRHQMSMGPSDNQQRGGRHNKDQASPQQNLLSPQNIIESSPGRHGAQDHIQTNQHGGHGYQGNQMSPHNSDSQLSMFGHMDSQFGIQDLMSMPGMRSGEGRNGGLMSGGTDNIRGRNQTGKQQDPGMSNTQSYSISQMLMLNQTGMVGNQQQQSTSGNQKVGDKSMDSEIQAGQHGMHAQTNQQGIHSGQSMTRGQQHGMMGSADSQHMHGNHGNQNMPTGQQNHNMHSAQQSLAGNMHDFSHINIGGNQHQQVLASHNIGGNQNVSHDGTQNQRGMFSSSYQQGDGTSSFHIQGNQQHSVFPHSNQQNQNVAGNPSMSGHQNAQGGQQGQNSGDHLKGDVKGNQHNFVQNCSGGSLIGSSQYMQNYAGDQQNSGYQHFSSTPQKQQYHGGKSTQHHQHNSGKHKTQQTNTSENQQFVYNNQQNAQIGMNQHHITQTQHEQQSPPGSQYKGQGGMSGQGQFGDQRSMQQKGIMSGMFDNSQEHQNQQFVNPNENIQGGFEDEQRLQGLLGATTEQQYSYDKTVVQEESGSQSERDGAKCPEQPGGDVPTEEDKTCEKETEKKEDGETEDVAKSGADKEEDKKEKGGGKKEEEEKEKGTATATPQKGGRDEPGIPYDWAVELLKGYLPGDITASAKMTVFFCILEESISLGDRILVFSQSLFTLNLMEELLQQQCVPGKEDRWAKSVNYYRLDGSTSAMEREKLINEFNSNPNLHLFLVSTRAGSLGINLVGANRVIVFDASWNPCHDTQAVCRVYRYGQKKPCFVYRLVTDNCLEKKIYDRQINKQGMSDRVVDECNPDAHLSIKEVTSLCWDDKEDEAPKDFSNLHDSYIDVVLQRVIQQHSSLLSKEPFQHESLLVDRKEKKLSQAEKRMAKRSYELEKQASTRPIYNNGVVQNQNRAKPMASVRPMQAEMTNQRPRGWIPASVWQRQGMSAQEMTLPLDVVIPTNSADRASIVLKAGQKVMVLKSPKGIYMQLENGKIIAIRTAMKMGGGKKTISTNQTTTLKGGVELIPRRGPGLARSISTTGRARPVRAVGPVSRPSSVPPVSVTVTRNRTSDTVPLAQLQTQSQSQSRSSSTTPLSGIHLPPGVTLQSVSSAGAGGSQEEAGQSSPPQSPLQPPQSPQTQSEEPEPTQEAPLLSPQSDHSQPESQQSSISQPQVEQSSNMPQPQAEESTMMSQPQSQESTMMSQPQSQESTTMSQLQSQDSTMMSQPQSPPQQSNILSQSKSQQPTILSQSQSQQSTLMPPHRSQQSTMSQPQSQQSTVMSQPLVQQSTMMSQPESQQSTLMSQPQLQQSTIMSQPQSQQPTMMSPQPQAQQSTMMSQPQSQHSKVMSQVQSQQSSIISQHLSQQSTVMSQPLPQQSKVMSQVQSQQSTLLSQHQPQQSTMLSQHQPQQSSMLSQHQSSQSTMSQPLPQQSKVMSQVQSQQSAILSQSQHTQHQPQQATMFSQHPQQQSTMSQLPQQQSTMLSQHQPQQSAMSQTQAQTQSAMLSQAVTGQPQMFAPSSQSQLLPPHTQQTQLFPPSQQSQLLPPPSQQQSQLLPPSQQHSQLFPPPQHSQLPQSSHFLGQQQSPSAYLPPTAQHPLSAPQYLPGQQYLPTQYPPLPHYSVPPSHYLPPPSPSHPSFLSTSPTHPQFLPTTHPSQQPQYLQHPSAQSQLMAQQPQSFGAVHHRLREEERGRSAEGTKRGDKEVQPNPFTAAAAASLSNLVQQQQPGGGTA